MRRWSTPAALVLLTASCAKWPNLEPARSETADWNEAFRSAQVILVGKVLSIDKGPRQLMRSRLAVENVLQGEAVEGSLEIYYFRTGQAFDAHERYVFFLTLEQGVLRAGNAIPVASGLHRTVPLPGRQPAEQVSTMLLTPGDGINAAHFARDLAGSVAFAMSHIGRWQTAKLLKQLAADTRPPIGQSACEQLTAWYWGQDACWDRLDAGAPSAGMAQSRAAEQERRARTADPDRWWKQMSAACPPAQLLDELRLLTTHKDPTIRARYCRFLRAHYPDERDCGCGAPVVAGVGQSSI